MSRIRTNLITNRMANGAPTVSNGLVITGVTTSTSFSGSGANLTNLPAQATIANNADDRVITGGSGVNLNGEQRLTFNSSNILTATETGTGNGMGGIRAATANAGGNAGYGFMTNSANRFAVTTIGSAGAESLRVYDDNNNAERIRISSTGDIIIGDTTATSQNDRLLQIGKTNRGATYLELRTSTSGVGGIVLSDGTGSGNEGYRGTIEYVHSSDYMLLKTAGEERLRIESDGNIRLADTTDNIIHTSHDASRLRLFGGSTESVNNGGVLTLHGVNHSSGNYTDLAAATGGHIQFRVGTSEKMRINSDGIMTRPQQPAFSMQGRTTPSDSAEGYTGILSNYINITECNIGGHYKTSGTDIGNFVAPVNGNYFFVASALLRLRSGSAGSGELTFHKNGANISDRSLGYSYVLGTNDHDNVTISAIISLAAGDKVALVSHACSSGCDWYWGQGLANFSGYLVG